jgi:hypothetical protein
MLISNQNIFPYLVEEGICRSDDSPPQEILRIRGKNFNLLLKFADRPPILVKQEEAIDGAFRNDFMPEAALQQLLLQFPALAPLRQWVPPILHYDPTNSILVIEFLEEYSDLSDVYEQPESFEPSIAAMQGQLLGQLHRLTFRQDTYREFLGTQDASLAKIQLPDYLAPISPVTPEMFACIRSDALQFFRLYQRYDSLSQAVNSLASKWQPCCLVHQDLRFANWLLHRNWQDVMPAIQLIDWEQAGWGDPLVDLADLIAAYLERWLDSLIPYAGLDVQTMLRSASIPLEALQPSLVTLIEQYIIAFPELIDQRPQFLSDLMSFTGRILIALIETNMGNMYPFGNSSICTLQVAKSLLCQPEAAVSSIFGCTPLIPQRV